MKKALFVLFLQVSFAFAQTTPCVPAGDEQAYGNDSWIGYAYDLATAASLPTTPITGFPYKGYVVRSEQFDQNLGTSALTASTLCKNMTDKFGVRYRMTKSYAAGYYAITVGGDDGYMLSVDGGATFTITNWVNASYRTTTKTVYLNGSTSLVLDYFENTGNSRVSFAIVPCGAPSEAPQSISGITTVCQGAAVTLTASGGFEKPGAVYQWGKGATVGSSVIAGQTAASITVNPTATTTYWVRRVDAAPCVAYSDAITGVVTVKAPSTAPTSISGNSFVCLGGSITLTTSGGTLQSGAVYEWGTGTTVGLNPIAGAITNSITVSPTTATTYWVRRTESGVCTSSSAGITKYVDVSIPEGNPTEYGVGQWKGYVYAGNGSQVANDAIFNGAYRGYVTESETFDRVFPGCQISAANLCGTYYTYYGIKYKMNKTFPAGYYNFSMGGDDGFRLSIDGGQTYAFSKWNVQGFTTGSVTLYLNGDTNLVYEYFQGPFSIARVKMSVTACTPSEAPTAVDGVTTICKGTNTQLTANGGFTSAGAIYQWGTGATAGAGTISGQTGASITVAPSSTTNYWVRRVDAAPCSLISPAYTFTVTVKQKSTAPTTLSATTPICTGTSTKLTVTGGTLQTGGVYEWSYGSFAGENVISTTTANNITVTPTTTTQYWVRRFDAAPCSSFTEAVSKTITVIVPAGDPSVFGDSTWNLYGYDGSDLTLQSTTYKGFYVNPDLNFNTQTGTNGWVNTTSPSASAGWSGCAVPNEYFTMVAKRKGFPCGTYNLSLSNWDDMTEVYLNGNRIWSCSAWNMANRCSGAIGSYYLDANSRIEIRVREVTGYSNVAFNATLTTPATVATAPSAINSPSAICTGSSASLQATGGVSTANAQYQWGTGTVGSSILGTQNSATLQVSPTESTTYWVRRVDTSCLTVTDATTVTVQVDQSPVAGTVSGDATVCATSNSTTLTLNGSQGNVQWQSSANGVDFTNISGETSNSFFASNLTA
ncbi:MAG: hypothetical protein CFE24_01760 [Flavobacterium sp. BFFFF2]|nr:MAG: hypothetical protein CFE24_01760 [Flavobacterium sp. BFFFF2]